MKAAKIALCFMLVFGGMFAAINSTEPIVATATTENATNYIDLDGMFFDVENVVLVEETEYGMVAYYTSDDAGCHMQPIRLSGVAANEVTYAIEHAQELKGELYLSHQINGVNIYDIEF